VWSPDKQVPLSRHVALVMLLMTAMTEGWLDGQLTTADVSSMPRPGNGFSSCGVVRMRHNERLFVNGVASVTVAAVNQATSPIKTSPAERRY